LFAFYTSEQNNVIEKRIYIIVGLIRAIYKIY